MNRIQIKKEGKKNIDDFIAIWKATGLPKALPNHPDSSKKCHKEDISLSTDDLFDHRIFLFIYFV